MSKATLSFALPEEREEFHLALHGAEAHYALHRIRAEVFRPARKHGYSIPLLAELSERDVEVIEVLEALYSQILEEEGVDP